LKSLSDRLDLIGNVGQGELIRADDWNTLVGSVVEIARVVLAEDHAVAAAPHEHPDQITVGWLEPKLRALIERGPLSDPAAITRLGNLEQKADRLAQRIEEIAAQLGTTRDRVTEVTTRDLTRQNDITDVRRVVEGLSDSRESVRELRESLRSIQTDVTTAITVGQRFIVNGEPVDAQALLDRISSIEQLRENLRGPDGALFDAAGLENRLTELTNTLVTQATLDAALDTVRHDISPEDLAAIEGNLSNTLSAQVNTTMTGLGNDIRNETNARLAEVDGLVARAVSDSMPNITTAVLNTVRPEINSAVSAGMAQNQALFEKRLSETSSALSADFSTKIGDVQLSINTAVAKEFANQLPGVIQPIQSQVDALGKLVEPMDARLDAAEASLGQVATRVEEVSVQSKQSVSSLRNELLIEMDRRDQTRSVDLDTRLTQFSLAVDRKISSAILDNNRVVFDQVKAIAVDTATTQVNLATDQLRRDITVISRNSVADLVRTEIGAIQPVLTRNIANELNISRPR
jgi:hypothetical protein